MVENKEVKVYVFNGKTLSAVPKNFKLGFSKGIVGLFSVNCHPASCNTLVLYDGTDKSEFHHPTKTNFVYKNRGFQKFLTEKLKPKSYGIAGGMVGSYHIVNGRLAIDLTYKGSYRDQFAEALTKKGLEVIVNG